MRVVVTRPNDVTNNMLLSCKKTGDEEDLTNMQGPADYLLSEEEQ